MNQSYELMLVLNPALSSAEEEGARQQVRDTIAEFGGAITSEQAMGARRLAYSIKKVGQTYMEGVYHLFWFDLDPSQVSAIQRPLRLSEQVLRHMVVKAPPVVSEKPTEKPAEEPEAAVSEPASAEAASTPVAEASVGAPSGGEGAASEGEGEKSDGA